MSVHRYSYPSAADAAAHCGDHILQLLNERLSGESVATLAISGGSTPRLMFEHMAKARFDWDQVHVFWVDERAVPPSDPQSNYRLAEETLLHPAHIPSRNVHRVRAELRPDEAARQYADEIRGFFGLRESQMPHFDVIHRGMGPDAHTASLFPGEPLIDDRENVAAAVWVEKMTQWRITLLPGVLLAARHTAMLVCGADKAEPARAVFNEPDNPRQYPAQIGTHHGRSVTLFMDTDAAKLLGS